MSYILDALRKSERERRRGEQQSVHSAPLPSEGVGRRYPLGRGLLLLLLLNGLVLGGWLLFPRERSSVPDAPGAAGSAAPIGASRRAAPIPNFENLSSAKQSRLAPLKLTAHVHAQGRPQASFITLNGETLREGQQAKNTLRVITIERNGVILEHKGKPFRLRVDNR